MKIKEQSAQLEALLKNTNNIQNETINNSVDQLPEELEPAPLFEIDFDKVFNDLRKKARRTLNKIIKHIVPDNMYDDQYVKDKMEQDIESLAGLYYQVYSSNLMMKTLMENIGRGNLSPRNFEVFSQLSKNIADLNKQIMATEEVFRKTYVEIKYEVRDKENEIIKISSPKEQLSLINKGTKSLIQNLKEETKQQYKNKLNESIVEDAEIVG